jgi:steroid 5-alpha reductase family enzyme
VALVVAALVHRLVPIDDAFWRVALADLAATLAVFAFSRLFDNSSLYDAYWSVAPMAIAAVWLWQGGADARRIVVLALVCAWGVRLTYNWARHWRGMDHEDWRYVDLRHKTGKAYWLVSLLGIHLFPTAMVLGASASIYTVMQHERALSWLDALAFVVTAGAIAIEALADRQLHRFAKHNDDPRRILDHGLWAWSRHPNYFGETSFWWGLCLFALAAHPGAWWCALGPAAISGMFFFISIPLIDARMLHKRPHYAEHMARVSRLVPWPPS